MRHLTQAFTKQGRKEGERKATVPVFSFRAVSFPRQIFRLGTGKKERLGAFVCCPTVVLAVAGDNDQNVPAWIAPLLGMTFRH